MYALWRKGLNDFNLLFMNRYFDEIESKTAMVLWAIAKKLTLLQRIYQTRTISTIKSGQLNLQHSYIVILINFSTRRKRRNVYLILEERSNDVIKLMKVTINTGPWMNI